MSVPLLVAGHSHGHALGIPSRPPGSAPEICEVVRGEAAFTALAGTPGRDTAYWDALVAAAAEHVAAISWNGNQHYGYFMFAPAQPFDFILASDPQRRLDREATIVPESMLRAFFQPSLDELEVLLDRLRGTARHRSIVIGTPPPKSDSEELRKRFAFEPHFTQWAKNLGQDTATIAMTPTHLIVKLWLLIQDMLAEIAARHDALFVPVPEWALTPRSCLKPRFWSTDATHANQLFGARFMRDVIAAAETIVGAKAEAA